MPEIDTTARSLGFVEPGAVTDEEWDRISAHFDPRAAAGITRDQVFVFRFIAASDGLDAYYTKQDVETSLMPMAVDLQRGQSFLGNHNYESFAYGLSYNGEVADADALSEKYEPTFYRRYDRPELRATKWLIGDYYVKRGLNLNGEHTDDLISAMEAGILSKASITFTIGEMRCGIDGKPMGDMAALLFGEDTGDEECRHFPGLEYGGDLSYAIMRHNGLLETSGVYKNASPSSLYVARATAMAKIGMIPTTELRRIEGQIGQRLPRPERLVVPGITLASAAAVPASKEDPSTMPARNTPPANESTEEPGTPPETTEEPTTESPESTEEPAEGTPQEEPNGEEPTTDATAAEFVATTDRLIAAVEDGKATTAVLDGVAEAARRLDAALLESGREDTASAGVARQYEMREHAIEEALGEKLSVEIVRSLKADAAMGTELYAQRVALAKAARVRAFGENANADAYERGLLAMRDVAYVELEIKAYGTIATEALAPRRSTIPPDPAKTRATREVPAIPAGAGRAQPNLLERRKNKE